MNAFEKWFKRFGYNSCSSCKENASEAWVYQQAKITKLKQLLLLIDPSVSDVTATDLQTKQWNEFIKLFPSEL